MGWTPCSNDTECTQCDHPMRRHWTQNWECDEPDCPCTAWRCPNPHKDDGQ